MPDHPGVSPNLARQVVDSAPRPDDAARRLAPLEIVMRKMASEPKHRNAGMSIWILDQAPDWDRLLDRWDRASRLVVRMRQRLVDPALGLGAPVWVNDANFDLHFHVRRIRLPEPGTLRQLLEVARPVLMAPSDPARSPWEVTLVEGLEDGRAALLQKGDHTMTDGQGGMQMMQIICDLERDGEAGPMPEIPPTEEITPLEILREDVVQGLRGAPRNGLKTVGRIAGIASHAARHPRSSASRTADMASSIGRMFADMRAPRSPLLAERERSLSMRFDILEIALDDLKRAGKAAGGSVNDAFLAGLLGGLRRYHERHGQPIEIMPMGFAISVRKEGDSMSANRFVDIVIQAPIGIADARARLESVHDLVLAARGEPSLNAGDVMMPIMSVLPTPLLNAVFSGAGGDVNASNLPGPPIPLYMGGAKVERLYGFAPLVGSALIAGLVSTTGIAAIGINSDPAAIPDPEVMIECLRDGFLEVLELAGEHGGVLVPAGL